MQGAKSGQVPKAAKQGVPSPPPAKEAVAKDAKEQPFTRSCLHKQLRKTKYCVFHLQGICQFGDSCTFAHSCNELQGVPDLRKTRLCKAATNGGCKDPSCSFAHSEEELRSTDMFYKKTLCLWFDKGRCRNGDQCRFAHGQVDLRKRAALALGPKGMANRANVQGWNDAASDEAGTPKIEELGRRKFGERKDASLKLDNDQSNGHSATLPDATDPVMPEPMFVNMKDHITANPMAAAMAANLVRGVGLRREDMETPLLDGSANLDPELLRLAATVSALRDLNGSSLPRYPMGFSNAAFGGGTGGTGGQDADPVNTLQVLRAAVASLMSQPPPLPLSPPLPSPLAGIGPFQESPPMDLGLLLNYMQKTGAAPPPYPKSFHPPPPPAAFGGPGSASILQAELGQLAHNIASLTNQLGRVEMQMHRQGIAAPPQASPAVANLLLQAKALGLPAFGVQSELRAPSLGFASPSLQQF